MRTVLLESLDERRRVAAHPALLPRVRTLTRRYKGSGIGAAAGNAWSWVMSDIIGVPSLKPPGCGSVNARKIGAIIQPKEIRLSTIKLVRFVIFLSH